MKLNKIKNLVTSLAPTLGAAIGGPLGGQAGQILSQVLGVKNSPVENRKRRSIILQPSKCLNLKSRERLSITNETV